MVRGLASGLQFVHAQKVVHANLKSSNIFVSDDGRPLIAGFDRSISAGSFRLPRTADYDQLGSLRWMARELHWNSSAETGDSVPNTMTDIWAFGMVICELLTRNVPYATIHIRQVSSAVSEGLLPQEPDFRHYADDITLRALWLIARKCWNFAPSFRPSTRDILNDLDCLLYDFERDRGIKISSEPSKAGATSNFFAHTMIGDYLFKNTRRVIGKGTGEWRHKRFFWLQPHTRTLFWSSEELASMNVEASKVKSARINSAKTVADLNKIPLRIHHQSIVISTPDREIRVTASTEEIHNIWSSALESLDEVQTHLNKRNESTISTTVENRTLAPQPLLVSNIDNTLNRQGTDNDDPHTHAQSTGKPRGRVARRSRLSGFLHRRHGDVGRMKADNPDSTSASSPSA